MISKSAIIPINADKMHLPPTIIHISKTSPFKDEAFERIKDNNSYDYFSFQLTLRYVNVAYSALS
ncbi:hypothetical protein GCM10008915_77510 [Bifidobacterium pullorum subsp. gallinarum]|jgi:hypothetical protein